MGAEFSGDIAIDDIRMNSGRCECKLYKPMYLCPLYNILYSLFLCTLTLRFPITPQQGEGSMLCHQGFSDISLFIYLVF